MSNIQVFDNPEFGAVRTRKREELFFSAPATRPRLWAMQSLRTLSPPIARVP